MFDYLVETVLVSFASGGVLGAVVALNFRSGRTWRGESRPLEPLTIRSQQRPPRRR